MLAATKMSLRNEEMGCWEPKEGSNGAAGVSVVDGICDTTTVTTTPNPASQSSEMDLTAPDAALAASSQPLGAALDLSAPLAKINLSQFEPGLREFGVATCTDIADLEGLDCIEIGMNPLEVKHLMHLQESPMDV